MDDNKISVIDALKIVTESIRAWTDENKVEIIPGKGLSTNDYATEDKNKVNNIANNLVVIDEKLYLAKDETPVSSGVYLPSGEVDTTLSIPNVAADAKSTGEAIAELNKKIAILSLKEITISNFRIVNSSRIVEKGSKIKTIELAWNISREPVSLSLDGAAISTSSTSYTYDYGEEEDKWLSTTTTYRLKSVDERDNVVNASTTISFLNGVYCGVLDKDAVLDGSAISSLKKELRSDRKITFTVNAGANEHMAYALPANSTYGTPVFVVNTVPGGFYKAATIEFENSSKYTELYDIWLSDNIGLGDTTVNVI